MLQVKYLLHNHPIPRLKSSMFTHWKSLECRIFKIPPSKPRHNVLSASAGRASAKRTQGKTGCLRGSIGVRIELPIYHGLLIQWYKREGYKCEGLDMHLQKYLLNVQAFPGISLLQARKIITRKIVPNAFYRQSIKENVAFKKKDWCCCRLQNLCLIGLHFCVGMLQSQ